MQQPDGVLGCVYFRRVFDTQRTQHFTELMCLFLVNETELHGQLCRDALWVMASEIRNSIVTRDAVDKKFALALFVLSRFLFVTTNRQRTFGDRSFPVFVSTHFVLINL